MTTFNSKSFVREIAELTETFGIGKFSGTGADRTIFVGELPQKTTGPDGVDHEVAEALFLIEVPSPPPHEYVDTEYPVIDFWARSPYTSHAHAMLEQVFSCFHRHYGYSTANWTIYFSRALGNIVDVDRDREGGKLLRLSVQFYCRNLNNLS